MEPHTIHEDMDSAQPDLENRIKDHYHGVFTHQGVFTDRLSCTGFLANQDRRILHTVAYILLQTGRSAARGARPAAAHVTT